MATLAFLPALDPRDTVTVRLQAVRSLLDLYGHSLDGMNRALCRMRVQQRTIGRTDADPVRRAAVLRLTGRR